MEKYNTGDVWWVVFPFDEIDKEKHRPAIVIDGDTIAILAMYVTSRDKNNPYSIKIDDWEQAGLSKPSWTRIDKIISINEWDMDKQIGSLSERDLSKIFQLVSEIQKKSFHEFSLIAIKNKDNKYLLRYDDRWSCWLFPYIRSTEDNKENVDDHLSELFDRDISSTYVTAAKHCKYSVSDNVYKIYNHKLYKADIEFLPQDYRDGSFRIKDSEYKWMSMSEMENDPDIMDKNDDIVAFVKTYHI